MLLTRQFRLPAYVNEHPDGMLIETPGGLLDGDDPQEAIVTGRPSPPRTPSWPRKSPSPRTPSSPYRPSSRPQAARRHAGRHHHASRRRLQIRCGHRSDNMGGAASIHGSGRRGGQLLAV
ncbi:hypothetical protein ACGFNU_02320 [Spirillospora sp. NPDC048911]|uniref:hypothetical protein n=1 Tax=Spirillospora sp. NPDC048911 TaxID=3364527 RepID=UPI0037152079